MKKRSFGLRQTLKQQYPALGRFINRFPRSRLLYPLYLTDQLFLMRETVFSPRVPASFDGFTIAFITDIHYGPLFSARQKERLSSFMARCDTDALILGGDLGMNTDHAVRFLEETELPDHPEGAFAVFGNHENMGSFAENETKSVLNGCGIEALLNDRAFIRRGEESIDLRGFRDYFTSPGAQEDLDASRGDTFTIFVIHNPDQLVYWEKTGRPAGFDLCLCGHTHGGQVALFGHSVISSCYYGDRYRSGWYEAFGGRVLVSNGVGSSKMPVRLFVPPQAHIITLRRSEQNKVERASERL